MTPAALLTSLEHHLQRSGVPFARGDLIAFAEACGPVEEGPVNVGWWAQEFLRSQPLPGDVARIDAGE